MENDRPQDRAAEQPAAVAARLAGHLLRRRDRHGRQHLPRRPQRRAHADAVEPRPQRRLLARRPAAPLPAADHGPGVRLRRRSTSRRSSAARRRCSTGRSGCIARAQGAPGASAAARCASSSPATARSSPTCASTRARRSCASPTSSRSSAAGRARPRARSRAACRSSCSATPPFPPIGELPYLLTLPPYGFYWFSPHHRRRLPQWHDERPVPVEFPGAGHPRRPDGRAVERDADARPTSRALLARRVREQLEREVLPPFLDAAALVRARKGRADRSDVAARAGRVDDADAAAGCSRWSQVDARRRRAATPTSLPLALAWEDGDGERIEALLHCTRRARAAARARRRALRRVLGRRASAAPWCAAMARRRGARSPAGELRFWSTARLAGRRRRVERRRSSIPRSSRATRSSSSATGSS